MGTTPEIMRELKKLWPEPPETDFDKWLSSAHEEISKALAEREEDVFAGMLETVSDSGYWKVMCVAAVADLLGMDRIEAAVHEFDACVWREIEPAADDEKSEEA